MPSPGENALWRALRCELSAEEVFKRTGVPFENGSYAVSSFGLNFIVSPEEETIKGATPEAESILQRAGYFYRELVLYWLARSRMVPATNKLVTVAGLKGGEMFFRGSHTLPLDKLAQLYAADAPGFLKRGEKALGGLQREMGDAAIELMPINGLPVAIILWLADEEFPAGASLLFDSTAGDLLPLDVIWAASMLCIIAMTG
jgi:hypothetical protein